jgi:hypothetical protein
VFQVGAYRVGVIPTVIDPTWWPGSYQGTWSSRPPDPAALLQNREGSGWFSAGSARREIHGYDGKTARLLSQLDRKIADRERDLTTLSGKKVQEPPAPYTAPPKLTQALDGTTQPRPQSEASDLLAFQESLLSTYFSKDAFFASPLAKLLLNDSAENNWNAAYDRLFDTFNPAWMPQAIDGGGYDTVKLNAFRAHLRNLGLDAGTFARYSRELATIKANPRAYSQMAGLTWDYRHGLPKLKALRSVLGAAGETQPPHEEASGSPGEPAPAATGRGYVRPVAVSHGLHEALTALSREAARRGNAALPRELLAASNTAGESLKRDLRRGKLTRDKALEVLAPPLQAASEQAVLLARDFTLMEGDLQELRQRIEHELKATTDRAKATAVDANKGGLAPREAYAVGSRLDDVSLQIDELQTQLTGVDQLATALRMMHQNLVQTREFVAALQKQLHFVNPLAPNTIDNGDLQKTLAKLALMIQPK